MTGQSMLKRSPSVFHPVWKRQTENHFVESTLQYKYAECLLLKKFKWCLIYWHFVGFLPLSLPVKLCSIVLNKLKGYAPLSMLTSRKSAFEKGQLKNPAQFKMSIQTVMSKDQYSRGTLTSSGNINVSPCSKRETFKTDKLTIINNWIIWIYVSFLPHTYHPFHLSDHLGLPTGLG